MQLGINPSSFAADGAYLAIGEVLTNDASGCRLVEAVLARCSEWMCECHDKFHETMKKRSCTSCDRDSEQEREKLAPSAEVEA